MNCVSTKTLSLRACVRVEMQFIASLRNDLICILKNVGSIYMTGFSYSLGYLSFTYLLTSKRIRRVIGIFFSL